MSKKKSKDNTDKMPKYTQGEQSILSESTKKYDPNATAQDCINDLRSIQQQFPLKFITRNFYRIHGKYSEKTWNSHFGTFNEYRSQAGLQHGRDVRKLERQIAKHASVDIYRNFYDEEVKPYMGKYEKNGDAKRIKTIVVGSDFHDIDVDPFMLAVFIDTCRRIQPDNIIFNGDIYDNYEFGKYDKDPRKMNVIKRVNFVKTHIFGPIREACPNAQMDLVIGNHEWRILTLLANKLPEMKIILADLMGLTLANLFGLDEFKINLVSKLDLAAWNARDQKNELKENFKVYYGCFVAAHIKDYGFGMSGTSGHSHRPEMKTDANLPMGKISWATTGCMADTRAEYVEGPDRWTNGFNIVHVDTLEKTVQQIQILAPGNFVEVAGKFYMRSDYPEDLDV